MTAGNRIEVRAGLAALDLAFLRAECGITQATVAAAHGVSKSRVSAWERHLGFPRGAGAAAYLRLNLALERHLEIREG
jgi:DNA-binding transcriptional regulator YiaG